MRTITVAAILLALTASSGIASAQPTQRDANARGAERSRMSPEARDHAPGAMRGRGEGSPAAALLRQRDRLGLTDEQTQQLEALAATQRDVLAASPSQQLRLRADLLDATGRDADPAAARAALDKMSDAKNTRIVAAMQAREQARAVLTPAQLTRVQQARGPRGGMRSGSVGERGRRVGTPGKRQGRPAQGPRHTRG